MKKEMSAAALAAALFRFRKKLSDMQAAHELEEKQLKTDIADIESVLAQVMHDEGLKSVKVDGGTVGVQDKTVYKTDALLALRDHAMQNNELGLLNLSLSVTGVKEYMQRNEGNLPPHVHEVKFEQLYFRPSRSSN